MALVLLAAAAGGLLLRAFNRMRDRDPNRAQTITVGISAAARVVGTVASSVSMLVAALCGQPAEQPRTSVPVRPARLQLGEDAV